MECDDYDGDGDGDGDGDDDDAFTFVNIGEHVLDNSDACRGLHIDVSIVFAQ
jgi:hypothetical protein